MGFPWGFKSLSRHHELLFEFSPVPSERPQGHICVIHSPQRSLADILLNSSGVDHGIGALGSQVQVGRELRMMVANPPFPCQ